MEPVEQMVVVVQSVVVVVVGEVEEGDEMAVGVEAGSKAGPDGENHGSRSWVGAVVVVALVLVVSAEGLGGSNKQPSVGGGDQEPPLYLENNDHTLHRMTYQSDPAPPIVADWCCAGAQDVAPH